MDRVITADDVIRSGACADGVYAVLYRLHKRVCAAMPVDELLPLLKTHEKRYALVAADADGDGNGYGYGYGYGYGNGYGYGDGNGDGDGYGYGDGDGNGNGYGDGDGYGYG